METSLLSCLTKNNVPETYVFPPGKRPDLRAVQKTTIPIVDLRDEKTNGQHIVKDNMSYGFFQVINHGFPMELTNKTMEVFKEFFKMSHEEKANITNKICQFAASSLHHNIEQVHYWRELLKHSCTPLEDCKLHWPQKPNNYRETVGAYVTAVRQIGARVLELISEGLGLEKEYLTGPLSEYDVLVGNYYPICPDPSLTLGLFEHTDPSLITILYPGPTPGLQMRKDGQWFEFETLPNAFVVIVGCQLEVVSNGKLKSGVHRAVTNSSEDRISIAYFMNPTQECIIEPAKTDDGDDNPPLFRAFQYKNFLSAFMRENGDQHEGLDERMLEPFKINY